METQDMIDRLAQVLREVYAEDKLHVTLSTQLDELRDIYRHNQAEFSQENVEFLKTVGPMDKAVMAFIELKEDLADVYDLEDYVRLMATLGVIRNTLRGTAVVRRVEKERRELREKLPDLEQRRIVIEGTHINAKIAQLEQNPPYCRRGHHMIIRLGDSEYFWGCSEFPLCFHTKPLTRKQKEFLDT